MTPLEELMQNIYDRLRSFGVEPSDPLLGSIHRLIVHEARSATSPLPRVLVLALLSAIPDRRHFVVVFRKKKDDQIRAMSCIMDEDKRTTVSSKRDEASDLFTVWDTEKNAPRTFSLDNVYAIIVENPDILI